MNLSSRDRALIWHPYTQEKTADLPIAITHAQGSYVFDEQGKRYLDLISSWWVNIHGHANPFIAKAIYEQALMLEHIIFAGFTHEPAVLLCEQLQQLLPPALCRFFFSDNGSTAVEVALKMAYQYWRNHKRTLFLSFEGGYHGDTFGAMSVGCKSGFHDVFSDLCFKVLTIPYPSYDLALEEAALRKLDAHLDQYGNKIAAIIIEPLVQGASGMRMCRAEFIDAVIKRVRAFDILVIFDEVMTGFGRTGTYFALDQINQKPDFLCLSKAITGGFLPLALTVTTENVYESFLHDDWRRAFIHGHSYTANPLACAAALASLELLSQKQTQDAICDIHKEHENGLALLKGIGKNHRTLGTISAFDVENADMALIKRKFLDAGLLLRPLGSTIYLLPPYVTTQQDLRAAYHDILQSVS